ncbi:hypothetical protein SNOG_02353 [Parastagonospora nodorum SN15]|uniref:Uncharacterized protein n=1 Tax=Phaeosphaeria nodorum (strain SN15 / ATCC MYA-4574 / FGSC 10173) TaxID=321614 RepID=Q0V0W1_PHANO|nr:hypothetical protein SNOG_02353 [Parastagonospora nodorum SN15]EAT90565.1 hypothetical protein SNOG_02353 [Parastagonospora nodorum SN15]
MKLLPVILLVWIHIKSANSLPIEETPGFTPWPIEKRGVIAEDVFSNAQFGAKFGVQDDTCRGHLPKPGCWTMMDATVDKFLANRAAKTKDCTVPCLFYTSGLSGAAEREGNFVLRAALGAAATEGPRKYQTIWDLHDKKFYPNPKNWEETPEARCIYEDALKTDMGNKINGCQRLYFMAMSKAMAMECTGEVFVMTTADLQQEKNVPENGIWWETEFPTLIDGNRPQDKKVTKVPELTEEEYKALTPEQRSVPPEIVHEAEYWPTGHGATQLNGKKTTRATSGLEVTQSHSSSIQDNVSATSNQSPDMLYEEIAKRADREDGEILEPEDEDYPYPYSIDNMVEFYGGIKW